MFVECRDLDGEMMNGVGGVRVVGHVDKDGKLELKIKTKKSVTTISVCFKFVGIETARFFHSEKCEKKRIRLVITVCVCVVDYMRGHQFSNVLNERQSNMD